VSLVVVNSVSVEGRVQICEYYGYMVLIVMICNGGLMLMLVAGKNQGFFVLVFLKNALKKGYLIVYS